MWQKYGKCTTYPLYGTNLDIPILILNNFSCQIQPYTYAILCAHILTAVESSEYFCLFIFGYSYACVLNINAAKQIERSNAYQNRSTNRCVLNSIIHNV